MKLIGCILCYNESYAIPYIMPYFERMHFDKLIVYDNESTDNSRELLAKYPFVEIRTFKTDHKHNLVQSKIKSDILQEYKGLSDVWLYCADFDEVLYYDGDFRKYLEEKDKECYNILNQDMFELFSDNLPDLSDGSLIHEKCQLGSFWGEQFGHKTTLLKIDKIDKIEYSPGAHHIKIWSKTFIPKSLDNLGIKSFHIKYIDKEYMHIKNKCAADRRSDEDKRNRYGFQYDKLKIDTYFYTDWENRRKNCKLTKDYMNNILKSLDINSITIIRL